MGGVPTCLTQFVPMPRSSFRFPRFAEGAWSAGPEGRQPPPRPHPPARALAECIVPPPSRPAPLSLPPPNLPVGTRLAIFLGSRHVLRPTSIEVPAAFHDDR